MMVVGKHASLKHMRMNDAQLRTANAWMDYLLLTKEHRYGHTGSWLVLFNYGCITD